MKKTNYNGFSSEEDYQFILNIVKSVVDGNKKIHTYAVNMDTKHNINIVINDIVITEEGFDVICFAYRHDVTIVELDCLKRFLTNTITKHLNEVIKNEGWK